MQVPEIGVMEQGAEETDKAILSDTIVRRQIFFQKFTRHKENGWRDVQEKSGWRISASVQLLYKNR